MITPAWVYDPDIADWQQGMCDTYALAMLETFPHLRMGTLVEPYEEDGETFEREEHWFVHDDEYAYDSLGRHKLPYSGVNDYPLQQRLDQDPGNWFFERESPRWGYGQNGGPEDFAQALRLIPSQQPWLTEGDNDAVRGPDVRLAGDRRRANEA